MQLCTNAAYVGMTFAAVYSFGMFYYANGISFNVKWGHNERVWAAGTANRRLGGVNIILKLILTATLILGTDLVSYPDAV